MGGGEKMNEFLNKRKQGWVKEGEREGRRGEREAGRKKRKERNKKNTLEGN